MGVLVIDSAGAKQMMMRRTCGVLGLLVLSACSGSAIEVGPGGAGVTAAAGASGAPSMPRPTCTDETPLPAWPSSSACVGSNDLPLVGSWHGYIENQPAPWDDLLLKIEGANSDGLCGTLKVGNVEPPPPASDPNLDYPPGVSHADALPVLIPGFTMALRNGTTDGARVRFRVADYEGYRSWCELQSPYGSDGGASCGCLPLGQATRDSSNQCKVSEHGGSSWQTVDCGKAVLCGARAPGACTCTAAGCTASDAYVSQFDLRFTGDTAEGSDTEHPSARVHFTRFP